MRSPGLGKSLLVVFFILAVVYTIHLYTANADERTIQNVKKKVDVERVRPEKLSYSHEEKDVKLAEVNTQKGKSQLEPTPALPKLKAATNLCDMKKACDPVTELAFEAVSGAANIIGPSICVNGKWLMSNAIGNCNRGMNVVVVNGTSGALRKTYVFDLYTTESGEFKEVLEKLDSDDVIFMTTYDDATSKLRDDARDVLTKLGSKMAKQLTFRDNWIFVSGKSLQSRGVILEEYLHSDKEKNRFGNWPASIVLEGCLPRF